MRFEMWVKVLCLPPSLLPREVPVAEVQAALAFDRARCKPGFKPYAAPLAWLNNHATCVTDTYANPKRDGPRRLDEAPGVPYWSTFGPAIHAPIVDRIAQSHPRNIGYLLGGILAQTMVDLCVGASAVLLSAWMFVCCRPDQALDVLARHVLWVSPVLSLGLAYLYMPALFRMIGAG